MDTQHEPGPTTVPRARPAAFPVARPISTAVDHHRADAMLLPDMTRGRAMVDILITLGAIVLIWLGIHAVATAIVSVVEVADERSINVVLTLVGQALFVGVVLWRTRQTQAGLASVGLSGFDLRNVLLAPVALVGAYLAYASTFLMLLALAPDMLKTLFENTDRISQALPPMAPVPMALMMIYVAICEEVLFRGYLLTRLRRATGSAAAAVIVCAALFASVHGLYQVWPALIALFFIAVVWSVFVLWRRSVLATIIAHALFNTINYLVITVSQSGNA